MGAGRHVLDIDQGETKEVFVTWKDPTGAPYDVTGYSARLQIRRGDDNSVVADVTNAGIMLGGAAGTVHATISAATTADLPIGEVLVYDLAVTSGGGVVAYLIAGPVYVRPRVTVLA